MRLARAAMLSCCLLAAARADGLYDPTYTLKPVDQAVADLDPLAVSFRKIDTGLRTDGENTSLFTPAPLPGKQLPPRWMSLEPIRPIESVPYYFISPGVRARVDRINYLVRNERPHGVDVNVTPRKDGEFIELIPANTVFDLSPDVVRPELDTPKLPPLSNAPARLDLRVDRQVQSHVDRRIITQPLKTQIADPRVEPKQIK